MKRLQGYYKKDIYAKPQPRQIRTALKDLNKMLEGGPPFVFRVKLTTGTVCVVIMSSETGRKYNFTVCPTIDRKTWIDVTGPAIVCGADENEDLADITLTDAEMNELFKMPYEL